MNKDQVEGKVKDVAGRVERQTAEWTGDKKKELDGAAKQAEGKVQKAWGNVKEAGQKTVDKNQSRREDDTAEIELEEDEEEIRARRKAS
jgi:uncharacterized protein YjbJ (UPF0337 family)